MTNQHTDDGVTLLGEHRVGMVIEPTTTDFVVQCDTLNESPSLGSLVRCGKTNGIYGIVAEVYTRNADSSRPTYPRGSGAMQEAEIFQANPQIELLLTTKFRAITVGYKENSHLHQTLPPNPPRVYASVMECGAAETGMFGAKLDFLQLIFNDLAIPQDDILGLFLDKAKDFHPDRDQYLVAAGKRISLALRGDTARIQRILGRF